MATFHFICAFFALGVSICDCSETAVLASRYDSVEANSTLLDLLLEPGRDAGLRSSGLEAFDMLNSRSAELRAPPPPPGPAFPETEPVAAAAGLTQPVMQAELLQGAEAVVVRDSARMTRGRPARLALRGALPGIMVGLTCAIVLVAYLALVLYKRHEMIRNGTKHELLRTDEPTTETTVDV